MYHFTQFRRGLMVAIVAPWLVQCGKEAIFKGDVSHESRSEDAGPQTPPGDPQPTLLPPPAGSEGTDPADLGLTWQWPCEDDADTPAAVVIPGNDRIVGPGLHQVTWEAGRSLDVRVEGKLCPPKARNRDVVFAIDVSSSMLTNDPQVAGQAGCARYDAMVKTMAALPSDGTLRVGLVTFDHRLLSRSDGLFSDLGALRRHMESKYPGRTLESLVCDRVQDTRFDVALAAVEDVFAANSDPQNARMLFLVTDGQPDAGEFALPREQEKAKGLVEAQSLKDGGVVVATVMLGSVSDEHLKTLGSGPSYHAVAARASDLAPTLAALAANRIQSGALTLYSLRSEAATDRGEDDPAAKIILRQDLLKILGSDLSFSLAIKKLKRTDLQKDLHFSYSYRDRFQSETRMSGTLTWGAP